MKIGVDLGGSHIAMGVVSSNGEVIKEIEKRFDNADKEDLKNTIRTYIVENVKELMKDYEITDMGIAIPGTIKAGTILKSVNLGIENYNIVEDLEKEINIPIYIRNDAKCAAIAENEYGCLKEYNRSIFLTLGTGIGGAAIINGKLLDTGDLPGCEFGHITIEKNGIPCTCGKKGCFERYASMKVFKSNLKKALGFGDEVRGNQLFEMIKNNRPENENYEIIENQVNKFIENLSIGIANLINIFEPEAIGIGGSFVYFEEVLLERLKQQLLKENVLFNDRNYIEIKSAIFKNNAGIIGATL